jgi:hypothetical protein
VSFDCGGPFQAHAWRTPVLGHTALRILVVGLGVTLLNLEIFAAQNAAVSGSKTFAPATTPRFVQNLDGTVTDHQALVTWMQCAIGQTWSQSERECKGSALALTLEQARKAAQEVNHSETFHQDWRLPSLTELARITTSTQASGANSPRTNLQYFPNTPASFFWTSSAKASGGYEPLWYTISFGPEGLRAVSANSVNFARLVRSGN